MPDVLSFRTLQKGIFSAFTLAVSAALASPVTAQSRAPANLTLSGVPVATTAPHGMAFGALSLTNRRANHPGARSSDGSVAFGLGLGDAQRSLGWQVWADLTSLKDDPGDSGAFGLKVSRQLFRGAWTGYGSLQADYLLPWGDSRVQKTAVTGTFSLMGYLPFGDSAYPVVLSTGYGTRLRDANTRPGAFIGAGIGLSSIFGLSLAWTGDDLSMGLGVKPPFLKGVSLTLTGQDISNRRNNRGAAISLVWVVNDIFGK